MQSYLLKGLNELQDHLSTHYQLHQITKSASGDFHWQKLSTAQPVINEKPTGSAKSFFFSERESLFEFDGECFRETLPTPEPFVLFGVQSCDLTAISYQDQFFKDDPYYQARRQQALLVGIDCLNPCEAGFCPTVNAGPGVRENTADLILHSLPENNWLLLVTSNKGETSIAKMKLTPAHHDNSEQRKKAILNCEQQFPDNSNLLTGIEKLNANDVDNSLWQQMGLQCLSCSGCTTLCPTCSCYGTRSLTEEGKQTTHQRFWDSCLYQGFQKEASFHNPSEEAGSRVHRFWFHKFSNKYLKQFDRYGCVGCGRCEQACPGMIGVHSVMKRITDNA